METETDTCGEQNRYEANLKAYIHLREIIGEDSFMNLVANKVLVVVGKYGTYRIRLNGEVHLEQNIEIGAGKKRPIMWSLCVISEKSMPEADNILSLYLSITNDEDYFIQTVNFRNVSTNDEYFERQRQTERVINGGEPRNPVDRVV